MTIIEFCKKCDFGCDILFDCRGRHLVVLSADDTVSICEQKTEDNFQSFESGNELLDNYYIDSLPLRELWNEVNVADVY